MNSALPRKRLIAHVVFRDRSGRVLLCQTTFKTDWELPGGIVEPFETPRDGAIREVREELGVDRSIGRLLVVDWLPPYLGWDDACELIFDGGTIEESELDDYVLEEREIVTVRLCTLAEAVELITESAHRRLTVACTVGRRRDRLHGARPPDLTRSTRPRGRVKHHPGRDFGTIAGREPLSPPVEEPEQRPKLDLSPVQVIGGGLAAATAAFIGSNLGSAGTIIGAALVSVIAAVAGSLYTHTMRRTRDAARAALDRRTGRMTVARTEADTAPLPRVTDPTRWNPAALIRWKPHGRRNCRRPPSGAASRSAPWPSGPSRPSRSRRSW